MNEKLVSIVIPTYNREKMVVRCIKSIMNSTYKKIEIIIVDNASSDNTLKVLNDVKEEYGIDGYKLRIVSLEKNVMASGGRNVGILEAKGEYILFVDDDNELYPDMIEGLVREFEQDSSLGLAAPLAFSDGKTWTTSISYNWWTSQCYDTFSECVGRTEDYVDKYFEKKYQTWAGSPNAFMVSKAALDAVGGFDFSMYMTFEESDFACRILRAGYSEYIFTKPRTNHLGWTREKENSVLRRWCIEPANRAYYFCRNRTVFMKRYAKWYNLFIYYLFFFHAFTLFYSMMALREKRLDIAIAVIKGAWGGLFVKNDKRINIPINIEDYNYKYII